MKKDININTPNYLHNKTYNVMWDTKYPFPCLITDLNSLSEGAFDEYNKVNIFEKTPVRYYCSKLDKRLYYLNIKNIVELYLFQD